MKSLLYGSMKVLDWELLVGWYGFACTRPSCSSFFFSVFLFFLLFKSWPVERKRRFSASILSASSFLLYIGFHIQKKIRKRMAFFINKEYKNLNLFFLIQICRETGLCKKDSFCNSLKTVVFNYDSTIYRLYMIRKMNVVVVLSLLYWRWFSEWKTCSQFLWVTVISVLL